MSLSVTQQARPKGKGHWSWSVQLDGPAEELDRVQWVEYTLHPTFSPPVHRISDRASSFRLDAAGWGEFMIHVEIRYRDGGSTHLEHWLELDTEAPPRGFVGAPSPGSAPASAPVARGLPAQTSPMPSPSARSVPAGGPGAAAPGAAAPTGAPLRWLYLSSGLADRNVAARVREAVEGVGLAVQTGEDHLGSEISIEGLIRGLLEAADGVVFIVSDRESPWMRQELASVHDLVLPFAAVRAGGTLPMPGEIETGAQLVVDLSTSGDDSGMQALVEWARELPVRTKRPGSRSRQAVSK